MDHVALGAYDEECLALVQIVQAIEIDVCSVHHVEGARLGKKLVQDLYVMHLPVTDGDKGRDIPAQIKQSVQYDRRLRTANQRPREHRQTQINRGRIQRMDGMIELDTKRFITVQRPSIANQCLREVGVNPPVTDGVWISQRATRDDATEAHVIELGLMCSQVCPDITQNFSPGELGKRHAQILIATEERFHLPLSSVSTHTGLRTDFLANSP